ncbi:MAG TPA: protein kinase [Thermoanaerobaculia bacterium]|nr:protein kinase [Thermoanaerobaculia bacterium]
MNVAPGTRFGSYEVVQPLGAGGMGSVYRARDLRLGREVAIKFLRDELRTDRLQLHRFEREARAASTLNHPNIITIYEVGEWDEHPYIAMEYVEGERLRDQLAGRMIPTPRAVEIAIALAEGLAAAHARGIVHRDLKPENVMIVPDGRIKILDFGLAKSGESALLSVDSSASTLPGVVVGTAGYMAPEQARGLEADFRSDQFSLGAILYELFAGRSPFRRGSSAETLAAILHDEPRPLSEANPAVPEDLHRIVERCLQKDPAARYASTADLAHDLRGARNRMARSTAPGASAPRPAVRRAGRPGVVAAVSAIALAAAALIWIALSRSGGPSLPEARAAIPERKVLLVLPFQAVGSDPEWRLLGHGMAETVSTRLPRGSDLQVIPPSALPPAERDGDPQLLAARFGANLVLITTLRRSSDRIRASYTLLDPIGRTQLAGGTLAGTMGDLWGLEDLIADGVGRALVVEGRSIPRPEGDLLNPASQDRFLQAVGFLQRYDDRGSVERALALLEPLGESHPRSALIQAALGRAHRAHFVLTSEPAAIQKAMLSAQSAAGLDPGLPEVHLTLGEILMLTGRAEEAITAFERALEIRPDDPAATLALAQALDGAGRTERVEKTWGDAIRLRPSYWAGHNGLAISYLRQGRAADAIPHFREAERLSPDNSRVLANLGAAYIQAGNFAEAVSTLQRAADQMPSWHVWSNLGTSLYYLERFGPAREAFERAVELSPANHRLWLNLADARRWTGDEKGARVAYERGVALALEALELNPSDAGVHARLATAYAWSGDRRRAEAHLAKALELAPADPAVMLRAALLANHRGRPDEAFEWIRRAVAAGHEMPAILHDPELRSLRDRADFRKWAALQTKRS